MRAFCGLLTTLSVVSGDGTTNELERVRNDAVVVKTRYYLNMHGTQRNQKTPQSEQSVTWPRLETGTSRIEIYGVTSKLAVFGM
jgi:hypothetical protein